MKVTVLNGSPKGEVSNTMQYYLYIKKYHPDFDYQVFNIGREIGRIEREKETFDSMVARIQQSDCVIWVYPVFYFLVSSPLKRFIEVLFEKLGNHPFKDIYATAVTTSMHLFDHTSHNYIQAISEDLGMRFITGYSAQFNDLMLKEERKHLLLFAENFFMGVQNGKPVPREFPEIANDIPEFQPTSFEAVKPLDNDRILLITDQAEEEDNLKRMTDTLVTALSGRVEIVNIQEVYLKAGCRSCLQCTYDGVCQFDDDMNEIYRTKILKADAIVYAGTMKDRYLSSRWKMFFDRFFVNAHRPVLKGKQGGFIISGPLRQNPNLRQLFTGFMESFGLNSMGFITDEYDDSETVTGLIADFARRIVWGLEKGYRQPVSFLGVGGHKIMRDINYMAGWR